MAYSVEWQHSCTVCGGVASPWAVLGWDPPAHQQHLLQPPRPPPATRGLKAGMWGGLILPCCGLPYTEKKAVEGVERWVQPSQMAC